jgi:hypothetical protein
MMLYLRDPRNSTQKHLDSINKYSRVTGYKNQLTKTISFSIQHEKREKEYMVKISFTIASKKPQTSRSKLNKGCE